VNGFRLLVLMADYKWLVFRDHDACVGSIVQRRYEQFEVKDHRDRVINAGLKSLKECVRLFER